MSIATKQDPDLATLQHDLAALKRDVASLVEHLQAGATHGVQGAAALAGDHSRRLYRNAAAEGERALKTIGGQVERQPLVALLIAIGVGYIGGRILAP
jgi:hypothetical protein